MEEQLGRKLQNIPLWLSTPGGGDQTPVPGERYSYKSIRTQSDQEGLGARPAEIRGLLARLFGEVVWVQRDDQDIADGVLLPLVDARKDTGHRMTTNAWHALKEHHEKGYGDYSDLQIYRFFLAEVLEIVREATRASKRATY